MATRKFVAHIGGENRQNNLWKLGEEVDGRRHRVGTRLYKAGERENGRLIFCTTHSMTGNEVDINQNAGW